jgi:large subunit ribosomal protein L16
MTLLFPKKVKFRKWHTSRRNRRGRMIDSRGTELSFGSHGLKAETGSRLTSSQIEAARKAIVRHMKKSGKLWIRVFPDWPFTAKPAEVGMGKGKGDPQGYQVEVLPGRIIFEIDGLEDAIARDALRKAGSKLPVKSRIVARM